MNNVVQENVHGIRVVKSFVREDRETEKFTSVSGTIYKDFCKAERIMSLANPIMQLCVYGCMLAISWIGAHLVIASGNNPSMGLTTGQLSSHVYLHQPDSFVSHDAVHGGCHADHEPRPAEAVL